MSVTATSPCSSFFPLTMLSITPMSIGTGGGAVEIVSRFRDIPQEEHLGSSLFDLTGMRALITGSGQGIGLALAEGLAQHGAEIVLNGRSAEKMKTAAD